MLEHFQNFILEKPRVRELFGIPAWFGRCQLGDLTLVDPTGLKAAAGLRPATAAVLEPGLSGPSDAFRGEAPDDTDC